MSLRIAQVGMGRWGQNWAKNALPKVKELEVVAWVDARAEALKEARTELKLDPDCCFLSVDELLAAVDVDAVVITAALPGHVPVAEAALKAGKHVLTEKPFAPSVADAQRLVDLADQQARVLMVSQNYRFFPAPQVAAQLAADQTLGAVYAVNLVFRRHMPEPTARHAALVQPLLMDMAIHHFDLLRMVIGGEPETVYCYSWQPPASKFTEPPAAAMVVQFGGGVVVTYQGSWVSTGPVTPWAGEWRMECTGGEIRWTSRGGSNGSVEGDWVNVRNSGTEEEKLHPLPTLRHTGRAGALAAFVETVTSGKAPAYTSLGSDNVGSLRFMQAAIESAAVGQPVAIGDS
jgi:predicted dehydrogenase